ncbi:MAG: acyloxyacyl hydrolase [Bacteroidota bacterium]
MQKLAVGVLFFFSSISFSQAQNTGRFINQKYWGIFVQYGFAYYDLPEQDRYQPFIIGAIHHLPFYQTDGAFNIGVDLMPQIGLVRFNNKLHFEFGANVQFNFNWQVAENHIVGARVGAGPHFINVETQRQAKGFIFSDNFALFYRARLNNNQQIGISSGIRHISNAGLMQPNLGIDDIMIGVEWTKWIRD